MPTVRPEVVTSVHLSASRIDPWVILLRSADDGANVSSWQGAPAGQGTYLRGRRRPLRRSPEAWTSPNSPAGGGLTPPIGKGGSLPGVDGSGMSRCRAPQRSHTQQARSGTAALTSRGSQACSSHVPRWPLPLVERFARHVRGICGPSSKPEGRCVSHTRSGVAQLGRGGGASQVGVASRQQRGQGAQDVPPESVGLTGRSCAHTGPFHRWGTVCWRTREARPGRRRHHFTDDELVAHGWPPS